MSAGTASLCLTLMLVVFVCAEPTIITVKSGQDVTLTCRAPNNNITVVKWSRTDLGDKYVLLYQDGQFDPDNQHPSFKNRVDLQDRQMKDGDVSLILKDVTINDSGTYLCRICMEKTWDLTIIYLGVVPPGQPGGHTVDGYVALIVGLSVTVVLLLLLLLLVGFLIRKIKERVSNTDDREAGQPLKMN